MKLEWRKFCYLKKKIAGPESSTPDECSLYGELLGTKLRSLDLFNGGIEMLEMDQLMFRHVHKQNYSFQDP